jgi:hypothetical protein
LPFLLGVLKTVALPIGFGFSFVFIPYPLAKEEEGDLAEGKCMCIYRLTPAARANANVSGDAPPAGRCAWAECTEESVEEDQRERSTARSGCCWHCCCCCPRSWVQ